LGQKPRFLAQAVSLPDGAARAPARDKDNYFSFRFAAGGGKTRPCRAINSFFRFAAKRKRKRDPLLPFCLKLKISF
jgi:hypothetical protein